MRQRKIAGGNPVSKLLYHENALSHHCREINYHTFDSGFPQTGRSIWLSLWLVSCLYLLLFDTLAAATGSAETERPQQIRATLRRRGKGLLPPAQVRCGDSHFFAVLDDGAAGDGEAALLEGVHEGLIAQRQTRRFFGDEGRDDAL